MTRLALIATLAGLALVACDDGAPTEGADQALGDMHREFDRGVVDMADMPRDMRRPDMPPLDLGADMRRVDMLAVDLGGDIPQPDLSVVDLGADLPPACVDGEPCGTGLEGTCGAGLIVCKDGKSSCQPENVEDESCDALDNDCDGSIDEDLPPGEPCTAGQGACLTRGQRTCVEGQMTCLARAGEPGDEVCNGIDDDCDGPADEALGLGDICEVGEGVCRAVGTLVCQGGGEIGCSAQPRAPRDELCNGLDDDCDGTTDEGLGLGDPCQNGVGACHRDGERVCGAEGRVRCSAEAGPPRPERCNGIDDDCDAAVDETLGIGDVCEVGVGACRAIGGLVCGEAGNVICSAVPGAPEDERCNARDDDCDGSVDEELGLGDPCDVGLGACRMQGTLTCRQETVVCSAAPDQPQAEQCNAVDDDCDGQIDEEVDVSTLEHCGGCDQPCALMNAVTACEGGECRFVECDFGFIDANDDRVDGCEVVCQPDALDVCDGEDQDCDGRIDEDHLVEGCALDPVQCNTLGATRCMDGEALCDIELPEAQVQCDDAALPHFVQTVRVTPINNNDSRLPIVRHLPDSDTLAIGWIEVTGQRRELRGMHLHRDLLECHPQRLLSEQLSLNFRQLRAAVDDRDRMVITLSSNQQDHAIRLPFLPNERTEYNRLLYQGGGNFGMTHAASVWVAEAARMYVAAHDNAAEQRLYLARFPGTGVLVCQQIPCPRQRDGFGVEEIAVASDGARAAVLFIEKDRLDDDGVLDDGSVHFAHVAGLGEPEMTLTDHRQLTTRVEQAGNALNPHIVWNGEGYGALWEVDVPEQLSQIYLQRLDADGVPLADRQLVAINGHHAKLAFNGSEYGVVWVEGGERIWFRAIGLDGVAEPPRLLVRGDEPDISWVGDEWVVIWSQSTPRSRELFMGRGTLCR